MTGQTISHYRVLDRLGAGGMGVVYEAEDTTLGRHVALKFLSERAAQDPTGLDRFRREARAASALNHPNICTIYEIAESDGQVFIAMELLEGQSLDRRLREGPLPLEQLLEFGIQIADALDAAHAKGIVHRDIKPGNVLITTRKLAKVLDFGLAKLDSGPLNPAGPTAGSSVDLTATGAALGTAAYMSPEQARGEELDSRSDLFSFGALLYEMATGSRPFVGPTAAVVFSAILNRQPTPVSRLNAELPEELGRLIGKALEKDRDIRCQSAAEMRADLKRLRRDTDSGRSAAVPAALPADVPAAATAPPARRALSGGLTWGIAALGLALVAAMGYIVFTRGHKPTAPARVEYVQLTNFSDLAAYPAISPDGRMLAFVRNSDVYVKLLPDGDPVQLTHRKSVLTKMWPFTSGLSFSPDGSRIAYDQALSVWVVPVLGGEPQQLLPNATSLSWISPQRVLFSELKQGLHLAVVTAAESRSGERDVYVPPTERGMAHCSRLSPDGKWVLISAEMDSSGFHECRLVSFDGNSKGRTVGPPGRGCMSGAWSPDGQWMYMTASAGSGSHIWRQRFPDGAPEQISFGPTREESVVAAPDGRSLIAQVLTRQSAIWLHSSSGDRQVSSGENASQPVFLADGRRLCFLALHESDADGFTRQAGELWMVDGESGTSQRLLPGTDVRSYAISADDKRIAYVSPDAEGKRRLWIASMDRRFAPRQVVPDVMDKVRFGPEGELIYQTTEGSQNYAYRVREDGTGKKRALPEPIVEIDAVSPDRQWLVAAGPVQEEDNSVALFAHPLAGGPPTRLCNKCLVEWSPDGTTLYFDFRDAAMGVPPRVFAIPVKPGTSLPAIPAGGFKSSDQVPAKSAKIIPGGAQGFAVSFAPSNDPAVYARSVATAHGNIYRIPIPQ